MSETKRPARELEASIDAQIRRAEVFSRKGGLGRSKGKSGRWPLRLACVALAIFLACFVLPPFAWPIRGRVSSAYSIRHKPDDPSFLAFEFHRGIDIAAPEGSLIMATAPGVVVETGSLPSAGNYVVVRHLFGLSSRYYHLSAIDAKKGSLILLPFLSDLGRVGSTGRSTGPHLHFEIDLGPKAIPLPPRLLLAFHSLRRALLGF